MTVSAAGGLANPEHAGRTATGGNAPAVEYCRNGHPRTPENTYCYFRGDRTTLECRPCHCKRQAVYREKNLEKAREANRQWYDRIMSTPGGRRDHVFRKLREARARCTAKDDKAILKLAELYPWVLTVPELKEIIDGATP